MLSHLSITIKRYDDIQTEKDRYMVLTGVSSIESRNKMTMVVEI